MHHRILDERDNAKENSNNTSSQREMQKKYHRYIKWINDKLDRNITYWLELKVGGGCQVGWIERKGCYKASKTP